MPQIPDTLPMASIKPDRAQPSYNADIPFNLPLNRLEAAGASYYNSAERLAAATGDIGKGFADIAKAADDIDTRNATIDAQNREAGFQAELQKYLYDPTDGILNRKGQNAQGITNEAQTYIQTLRDKYSSGVSNKIAAAELNRSMLSMTNSAMDTTMRHQSQQRDVWLDDSYNQTKENQISEGAYNWNNDQAFGQAMSRGIAAAEHQANLHGTDPAGAVREFSSKMWESRVMAAMASEKPEDVQYGGQLFDRAMKAGIWDAPQIDRLGHYMRAAVPKAEAQTSFANDISTLANQPTLSQVFEHGVIPFESGGRMTGGAGSVAGPNEPTTSKAGAIGIAQVEPATGMETAARHGIAWDEHKFKTDSDYNANLGQLYLQDMYNKYGDMRLAVAAYNAGPGSVDDALKKSDPRKGGNYGDFINALPQPGVTGPYISKVMGAAQASSGPQLLDVSKAQANAAKMEPVAAQNYLELVTKHNTISTEAWNQGKDQTIAEIKPILERSNGQWSSVPTNLQAKASQYGVAEELQKNKGVSDESFKTQLDTMNSRQLASFDFKDPNVRLKLSATDYDEFVKKQTSILNDPKEGTISKMVDNAAKYVFQTDLGASASDVAGSNERRIGKNNNADFYDRLARFRKSMDQDIRDYATVNGGKLPDQNTVLKMADERLMNRGIASPSQRMVPVSGTHMGWSLSHPFSFPDVQNTKPISDLTLQDVPANMIPIIQQGLIKAGKDVDEQSVIDAYVSVMKYQGKLK